MGCGRQSQANPPQLPLTSSMLSYSVTILGFLMGPSNKVQIILLDSKQQEMAVYIMAYTNEKCFKYGKFGSIMINYRMILHALLCKI